MTNKQIDQEAQRLRELAAGDDHTWEYHEEEIARSLRRAASDAYESAAQRAEYHQTHCANDDRFYCPDEIAKEIRLLSST